MDAFYYYTYATAGWLFIQAAPLVASPKLVVGMLSSEIRSATSLEIYLSRSLGFVLSALALVTIFLRSAPLNPESILEPSPEAPYAAPVLYVTFVYHVTTAIYGYMSWLNSGQFPQALGMIISSLVALMGGWCLLFGRDAGHKSRRSGADKRTSGFPFKNAEAEKRKLGKSG